MNAYRRRMCPFGVGVVVAGVGVTLPDRQARALGGFFRVVLAGSQTAAPVRLVIGCDLIVATGNQASVQSRDHALGSKMFGVVEVTLEPFPRVPCPRACVPRSSTVQAVEHWQPARLRFLRVGSQVDDCFVGKTATPTV